MENIRSEMEFDLAKMRSFYEYDANKAGRELAYGRLSIVLKELKKRLGAKHKQRVLDIGVSDGFLIERIGDIGVIPYGIDIAFSMLKLVPRERPVFLIQSTVTHLPFVSDSFDMITACEILEHLDKENLVKALKELYRVLVPGGYLFVTTPYNEEVTNSYTKCPECGYTFPPSGHYSSFDENKWQYYIMKIGFSKISFKNIYGTDFRLRKFNFFSPLIGVAARLFAVDSLTKMFVIIRK